MSALEDSLEAVTDPDDEDVIAGVLEALLDELSGPIADAKHSKTLRANGYCLVSELREVSRADLEALGLQPGHAKAVVRKIYATSTCSDATTNTVVKQLAKYQCCSSGAPSTQVNR